MFETTDFQEIVRDFQAVTPAEAGALLEEKEGAIVFLGRDTCPYCRRFAPKLATVAKEQGWTVYFLHTQHPDYSAQEIAALRDQYGVPTVPGLLHATATGVQVRCDSSMTEEDIRTFIEG